MTPGEIIFTYLGPLVNNKCYPNTFPEELIAPPGTVPASVNRPTWPAIRYQEISALNPPDIKGTGDEDTDDKTYQIDVVAAHYGTMRSLVRQVIAALESTLPPCTRDFQAEEFDTETKTHRGILRYTFYGSTPVGSP